jgi:predicted transcriptional regulator
VENQEPNRSRAEIVADILRLLRLGEAGNIEISQISQISTDLASIYLQELVRAGFLEDAEERMGLPSFRITKKGLELLNRIEALREKIPGDQGARNLNELSTVELQFGRTLVTKKVAEYARQSRRFAIYVQLSLERYRRGDKGEIVAVENDWDDLSDESGVFEFASYVPESFSQPWILASAFPELWVYTTTDRSFTIIMFREEYDDIESLEPYWGEPIDSDRLI